METSVIDEAFKIETVKSKVAISNFQQVSTCLYLNDDQKGKWSCRSNTQINFHKYFRWLAVWIKQRKPNSLQTRLNKKQQFADGFKRIIGIQVKRHQARHIYRAVWFHMYVGTLETGIAMLFSQYTGRIQILVLTYCPGQLVLKLVLTH